MKFFESKKENNIPKEAVETLHPKSKFRNIFYSVLLGASMHGEVATQNNTQQQDTLNTHKNELALDKVQEQDFIKESDVLVTKLLNRPDLFSASDGQWYFGNIGEYEVEFIDYNKDHHFDLHDNLYITRKENNGNISMVSSNSKFGRSGLVFNKDNLNQDKFETIKNGQFVSETGIIIRSFNGDAEKLISRKLLNTEEQIQTIKDLESTLKSIPPSH